MSNWTQSCCERCWIEDHYEIKNVGDGETDVRIRLPVVLKDPEIETCCKCGEPTIMGLYIRVDPNTVKFPTLEKT